jgi:hypothetical protein
MTLPQPVLAAAAALALSTSYRADCKVLAQSLGSSHALATAQAIILFGAMLLFAFGDTGITHRNGFELRERKVVMTFPNYFFLHHVRAFITRALRQMNFDVEPPRDTVGRPPGTFNKARWCYGQQSHIACGHWAVQALRVGNRFDRLRPPNYYTGYGDGFDTDLEHFVSDEMRADWETNRDDLMQRWRSGEVAEEPWLWLSVTSGVGGHGLLACSTGRQAEVLEASASQISQLQL